MKTEDEIELLKQPATIVDATYEDIARAIRPCIRESDLVALAWPAADDFGYEDEAFLLQDGHGIGLSLSERPILSRRFSIDHLVTLKEGMIFDVEAWAPAADGSCAARIEKEAVVTKDGCEVIINYPSEGLISCCLPGCDVY